MRSRSGPGTVSSMFAVVMKMTLREVERQVEVVVAERRVLLRVEHLEHRRRGVAAEVGAHLVDLVEHEHRVGRAGVAQRADDRAGHRADVGAAVAADLGLVAHAAHADALELAAERAGDRLAERRLADAGRADEAEDRAARVRLEPAHGEVLEDPVLDLLDVVVVGVEHLARVLEVEVVGRRRVPRQRGQPLEVGADHAVLGGGLRQLLEPRELALGLAAHLLGQRDRVELLAQLLDLGLGRVALAQLLLDRLELLAQEVLALRACRARTAPATGSASRSQRPRARARGSPRAGAGARQVALLQQLLLLLGLDPHRGGDQVRERRRVVDVRDRDLQLLGQVGDELDDAREHLLDVARERLTSGPSCAMSGYSATWATRKGSVCVSAPGARAGRPGRGCAGSRRAP